MPTYMALALAPFTALGIGVFSFWLLLIAKGR